MATTIVDTGRAILWQIGKARSQGLRAAVGMMAARASTSVRAPSSGVGIVGFRRSEGSG